MKDKKLQEYQEKENVILICFKTKKNQKDYQAHFKCKSGVECPFRIKLCDKDSKIELFASDMHNHDQCLEDIGKILKLL